MAGVKGRSGGARPNSGPKRKPADPTPDAGDAVDFLMKVMRGDIDPSSAQLAAAQALVRAAAVGVKQQRQKAAEEVAAVSKFQPRPAPLKLVSSG